ncbi:hypothetical protein C1T31_10095 [Hanstruepera neustonica]|uniref:DUF1643 domain-containing protein n=1 Tax=Hanstruepera neustonica TaxID=1445657 RepID=A0A2K1DXT3_9FLAO|nr:DUF1643 domain-containing protein [Hanstruepera neustonica]PNQ72846.1 hypothetical protein C1T31_10095 [Hanstruepera neustonica]
MKYLFDKTRFFPIKSSLILDKNVKKRYAIEIELKGKRQGKERWLVILKNPSRAGENDISESDCTVNRVCEYFFINKPEVSSVIIMNLFPVYQTYSEKLIERSEDLIDAKNKSLLIQNINAAENIVLAWGGHPWKCKTYFDEMETFIFENISNKNLYQMKHPRWGLNLEKPLHGQVWGYKYELKRIN